MTSLPFGRAKEPWPWSRSQLCQVLFERPPVDAAQTAVGYGQMERREEIARAETGRAAGAARQLLVTCGMHPGKAGFCGGV